MTLTRAVLGLMLALAVQLECQAAPPPIAVREIHYLLDYVGNSGCAFFRNGSWYDATQARAHLLYKYELAADSGRINSAEEFIDEIATKSSFSGRIYEIRCGATQAVASGDWLRQALARFRGDRAAAGDEQPAPGAYLRP